MSDSIQDQGNLSAVVTLLGEYGRRVDDLDGQGWSELFMEDGSLVLPARTVLGRTALAAFASKAAAGVHITGAPSIVSDGHGDLTVTSSFLFVNAATGVIVAGYYADTLQRADGRLLFAVRRVDQRVVSSPAVAQSATSSS